MVRKTFAEPGLIVWHMFIVKLFHPLQMVNTSRLIPDSCYLEYEALGCYRIHLQIRALREKNTFSYSVNSLCKELIFNRNQCSVTVFGYL